MKIFIYKLLISLVGVYNFSIDNWINIKKLESKVSEMTSKENIELTKKKFEKN